MKFNVYQQIDGILNEIRQRPLVFVYVTTDGCSVCHGLQPQVEKIMSEFPEVYTITVSSTEVPAIASEFQVFTAPALLLFVEGKEYLRRARMISTKEFTNEIEKIVTGYLNKEE